MPNRRGGNRRVPAAMPAGDARRERQREVADELAERIETEMPEAERINPRALHVENELAQNFNLLDVSNPQVEYRYCWAALGQHGLQIKVKLSDGWEVVQGDMPEAIELKGMGADTTRKLGDVMLMRCRVERYILIQRREQAKARRQADGTSGNFEEILKTIPASYGATAIVDGRDVLTGEMVDAKRLDHMWKRSQANARGGQIMDKMLRNGTMPGVPVAAGA